VPSSDIRYFSSLYVSSVSISAPQIVLAAMCSGLSECFRHLAPCGLCVMPCPSPDRPDGEDGECLEGSNGGIKAGYLG
jgi:hypothetical protein